MMVARDASVHNFWVLIPLMDCRDYHHPRGRRRPRRRRWRSR